MTWSIIYIISALQGYFLAVVFLTVKKENRKSNLLFSFFLFFLSTILLSYFLDYIDFFISFPEFLLIKEYLYFLLAPLYYFYVISYINYNFKFKTIHILNLLPLIIFSILTVSYYLNGHEFMVEAVIKGKTLKKQGVYGLSDILVAQIFNSVIIVYLILSHKQIKRFCQRLSLNKNKIIELHRIDLLKKITSWILIIVIIEAVIDLFHKYYYNEFITPLLFTLFFYGVIYLGLKQSNFLKISELKKYKTSNLTSEKTGEVFNNLLLLMEKEKVFLDDTLSLSKLAIKLKVSPHQLSQVINKRFNQNFFNFVNTFRVEEAKKKLKENSGATINISEIAFSIGFNSLSAFNKAFKKHSDKSPSKFRKLYS
jgi:AraC-like DNA-binding protein